MMATRCMFVLVLILVVRSGTISGLRCLSCSNIQHPETCDKVIECAQGDVCFMQEHITTGGLIQFNTGCMSASRCNTQTRGLSELFGLRESRGTDLVTCEECCHGNYCNIEGCGQTARKQPDRGPLCFQCSNLDHPDDCRDVVMCDVKYKCIIRRSSIMQNQLWSIGCSPDKQCEALSVHTSQFHCTACCDGDFCNDHCLDGTSQLSSTTHNVSSVGGNTVSPVSTVSQLSTGTAASTPHETSGTVQHTSTTTSTTDSVASTPHETSGTVQHISRTNSVTSTPYETSGTVQHTSTTNSVTSTPHETSGIVQHISTTLRSVSTTPPHTSGCLNDQVDVVFLVDASRNGRSDGWISQLEFVRDVVNTLPIGTNGARFALITYSNNATNVIPLDNNLSKDQFIDKAMQASYIGQGANLQEGLHFISRQVLNLPNLRRNSYVIAITNKDSDEKSQTALAGKELKANDPVTVFALNHGDAHNPKVLQTIASNDKTLFEHVKSWQNHHIIDTITSSICHDSPCKKKTMDVCFVLDYSANLAETEFRQQLQFITMVMSGLDLGGSDEGQHRVCIIVISTGVTVPVTLSQSHLMDSKHLMDFVQNIPYSPNQVGHATAPSAVIHNLHLLDGYGEKKLVVLTTGRKAFHIQQATKLFLQTLQNHLHSIDVIAIGTGNHVDREETNMMTSYYDVQFRADQQSSLSTLQSSVVNRLCGDFNV